VAFLLQVLHAFEGDLATAGKGQVFSAGEFRRLVGLVTAADQQQVAARADFRKGDRFIY